MISWSAKENLFSSDKDYHATNHSAIPGPEFAKSLSTDHRIESGKQENVQQFNIFSLTPYAHTATKNDDDKLTSKATTTDDDYENTKPYVTFS